MSAKANIEIEKPEDWLQFHGDNLDTIVDPMVFRSADIFFRGRTGAHDTLPVGDSEEICTV